METITLYEQWDIDRLNKVLNFPFFGELHRTIRSQYDRTKICKDYKLKSLYTGLLKVRDLVDDNGFLKVKYQPLECNPEGRFFANPGYQGTSFWIRSFMGCKDRYQDIDISNCYPNILNYLTEKKFKNEFNQDYLDYLKEYVDNREKILKQEMKVNKWNRREAKNHFLKVIHDGRNNSKTEFSLEFEKTIKYITETFKKMSEFEYLYLDSIKTENEKVDSGEKNYKNIKGSFISKICQIYERKIITSATKIIKSRTGHKVRALCHDGFMIEPKGKISKKELELIVSKRFRPYIRFEVKEFADVEEFVNNFISEKQKLISALWFKDQFDLAAAYSETVKDKLIYVPKHITKGNSKLYEFDEETRLWKEQDQTFFHNGFAEFADEKYNQIISIKEANYFHTENSGERKVLSKEINMLKTLKSQVKSSKGVSNLACKNLTDEQIYEKFDQVPHLFPIAGGKCVNLKTGKIEEIQKEHFFTRASKCTGLGDPGIVREFLSSIQPNPDNLEYVQKMMGLCISNEPPNRRLFIFLGSGGNGKTILNTLLRSVSPMVTELKQSALLSRKLIDEPPSGHTSALTPLKYNRCAIISETNPDQKLYTGLVKKLTGGDPVVLRKLHQEQEEPKPIYCKIIICSNNEFDYSGDDGLRDRLNYIYFPNRFVDNPTKENEIQRDESKVDNLLNNHLNDILAFFVEGSRLFYKEGLIRPPEIEAFTKESFEEVDQFESGCRDLIEENKGCKVKLTELKMEMEDNGIIDQYEFSARSFKRKMVKVFGKDKIFQYVGTAHLRGYRLKSESIHPSFLN